MDKENSTTETTSTTGSFDAEAFEKRLIDAFDKKVNAIEKNYKKLLEKAASGTTAATQTTATEVESTDEKPNPNASPEFNQMVKQVKALTAKIEERDKAVEAEKAARLETERKATIRDAMSGIQFRDRLASDMFFKAVNGDIVRNDEGQLVARTESGDLPVKDYIAEVAQSMEGYLAPKGMGGTGAAPSKAGKGGIDLDSIKPGMDRSALMEVLKQASMLSQSS